MAVASTPEIPVREIDLGDLSLWTDGPPHAIFERLRSEAPVHWSPMNGWEGESGFWSITRTSDIHEISRDWETFSSERGGILAADNAVPIPFQNAMFIGMDPPRHDRIKALFQRGFTPKRIADHEQTIRAITCSVLDDLAGREEVDLASEVAQPIVSRVIGRFLGVPEDDDEVYASIAMRAIAFGDDELQPEGSEQVVEEIVAEFVPRVLALAAERRAHPADDLTSVLVHAEIDGERLEDHEIVFGFALLVTAGNDSTKATYANGMLGLLRHPDQLQKLIDEPAWIPDAIEELLRLYPAFAHFRRTATRDVVLHGRQIKAGDKVVLWYPSANRDEALYECPHALDVERRPEHQAFGAGGRHFCLGTALARLELRVMFEETLARFPRMELAEEPQAVRALFMNQPRSVRVRLNAG